MFSGQWRSNDFVMGEDETNFLTCALLLVGNAPYASLLYLQLKRMSFQDKNVFFFRTRVQITHHVTFTAVDI